MSFITEWSPDKLDEIRSQWASMKVPADGNIDAEKAIKLQLAYQAFASELSILCNQARLHEKRKIAAAKRKETEAFLTARSIEGERLSDRKREAMASQDREVKIAKADSDEAEVYRKLLEDMREDAIRSHYALRAVLKDRTEEKAFGYGG